MILWKEVVFQNLRMEWKIHVSMFPPCLWPGFGICLPLHELPSGWSYRCRWDRGLPVIRCFWKVILLRKPNMAPSKVVVGGTTTSFSVDMLYILVFGGVYNLSPFQNGNSKNCFAGQDRHYLGCKERAGGQKHAPKKQSYLTCRIVPRETTFNMFVPGYSCNSNWPWKCSPGSFLRIFFQLILKFRSQVELTKNLVFFWLPSVQWTETTTMGPVCGFHIFWDVFNQPAAKREPPILLEKHPLNPWKNWWAQIAMAARPCPSREMVTI